MNTLNKSVGGEGHQKNSDDGNEKHGKYTVKFYPKDLETCEMWKDRFKHVSSVSVLIGIVMLLQ